MFSSSPNLHTWVIVLATDSWCSQSNSTCDSTFSSGTFVVKHPQKANPKEVQGKLLMHQDSLFSHHVIFQLKTLLPRKEIYFSWSCAWSLGLQHLTSPCWSDSNRLGRNFPGGVAGERTKKLLWRAESAADDSSCLCSRGEQRTPLKHWFCLPYSLASLVCEAPNCTLG